MRQPERPDDADNPLRLCYAGPAPERDRHEQIERRFGIQIVVGYAMSESPYGLIWRHGTRPYGTLGQRPAAPVPGTINEAKVVAAPGPTTGLAARAASDGRRRTGRRRAARGSALGRPARSCCGTR